MPFETLLVNMSSLLQREKKTLEAEQVKLRVEMATRVFEQDKLLYTARKAHQVTHRQLEEAQIQIVKDNERIAELEKALHLATETRDKVLIQADQLQRQVNTAEHSIDDLQSSLQNAHERMQELEQQIAYEQLQHQYEQRLIYLEGEDRRLTEKWTRIWNATFGIGSVLGMIGGFACKGVWGAWIGSFVGMGIGGAAVGYRTYSAIEEAEQLQGKLQRVRSFFAKKAKN